jgi:hypothetical protein
VSRPSHPAIAIQRLLSCYVLIALLAHEVAQDFDRDLVKNDEELIIGIPHGMHQGVIYDL